MNQRNPLLDELVRELAGAAREQMRQCLNDVADMGVMVRELAARVEAVEWKADMLERRDS